MTSPSPSTALSVGSDDALLQNGAGAGADEDEEEEGSLPQCKIKRNYTCSHCNYFTQNPRNFLYHLRGVHKEKLRIYECPSCLYASKHSQKLQRHVHMVHVMGKGRKKTTNPKPPKPPKPKKEPSPSPEDFPWDAKEEDDEEGEEEEESVTDARCSQCPFTDKSKALVVRHEQAAHLRKKFYRCAKCNYMTHLRARYTKHVKYHSMPMIKCAMCDFRTPYKWNLDRHYKNHTGDGAFRCSLCNFTADIKQSLTVHEMNHHVPPAAGLAPLPRRRNKVGASDCDAQLEVDADADDVQCKVYETVIWFFFVILFTYQHPLFCPVSCSRVLNLHCAINFSHNQPAVGALVHDYNLSCPNNAMFADIFNFLFCLHPIFNFLQCQLISIASSLICGVFKLCTIHSHSLLPVSKYVIIRLQVVKSNASNWFSIFIIITLRQNVLVL